MTQFIKKITIFLSILYFSLSLLPNDRIKLNVMKISEKPKLDGLLNEKVWKEAKVFSDFKMVKPETGKMPSERTELRIIYSERHLYIGIKCFSDDVKKISQNTLKYDQHGHRSNGDDLIRILIDPFLDMRNAYVFVINPGGARTDGLASGEYFSSNWDGIWDAVTSKSEEGWCAEIDIPFKTLTFNSGISEWGFNVERYIARKMEIIRLSGISKNSFFYNPAEAARAGDFNNIKQGLGLTFKPYLILSAEKTAGAGSGREWKLDGGFDLYKNFTSNLVGVFTYNTDFAETEVDERRINLTRFSLYYPEKRSFFLEGSDIFSFGSGMFRSFIPFFSRTIGLYEGEHIVPIEYGIKIFGKTGKTNLGLLNVKTKDSEWVPGKNFTAGRVYQNIFEQSKVGMIFTKGNPDGIGENSLLGFDFNFSTSKFLKNKNFSAGAWWVYNWNTIDEGDHSGYGLKLDYPNDLWDISFTFNHFGDSLEPGMAYLPRNNIRIFRPGIQFKPRPEKGLIGKIVRQFYYELFVSVYKDLDGRVVSSRIFTAPINLRTESGEHIEFNVIPEKEVLDEPFWLSDEIVFPVGEYNHTRYRFEFNSASHRKLDFDLKYLFGNFYSGKLTELNLGLSYNHGGNFNANVSTLFLRGSFPEGDYRKNLFRISSDFFLNPDMGLMGLLQYDDNSNEMGANIRFKWRISPGNVIYLVYNKNWERVWDPASRFQMINDLGIFKIQLSVRP